MILALIGFLTSFAGSMLSLLLWVHFDLEGYWQARRVKHGKHLDDRQRKAANRHKGDTK